MTAAANLIPYVDMRGTNFGEIVADFWERHVPSLERKHEKCLSQRRFCPTKNIFFVFNPASAERLPAGKVAALPSLLSSHITTISHRDLTEAKGKKGQKVSWQAMRGSARRGSEGSEPHACPRGLAGTSSPVHPGPNGSLAPSLDRPASEPSRSDTSGPSAFGGGACATPRLPALRKPCSPRPQRGPGGAAPFPPFPRWRCRVNL
jgi:hypothetical protein